MRPSVLLLVCAVLWSCVDRIEFDSIGNDAGHVAINGHLTRFEDTSHVFVQINQLFNFQYNERSTIKVEYVHLVDEDGERLPLEPLDIAKFETKIVPGDAYAIRTGVSYHIEIKDIDGKIYRSLPEQMLACPPEGELHADLIEKPIASPIGSLLDQAFASISATLPVRVEADGQLNRFRFHFSRTWRICFGGLNECFIHGEFQVDDIVTFDANTLYQKTSVTIPIIDIINSYRFADGLYFHVTKESLTARAHQYFSRSKELLERTGNMFEPPVGQLTGNCYAVDTDDPVFGYFYATTQQIHRIYIPHDFFAYQPNACEFLLDECFFCGRNPDGSQWIKPDFWLDKTRCAQ